MKRIIYMVSAVVQASGSVNSVGAMSPEIEYTKMRDITSALVKERVDRIDKCA
jgi:hypothetical protein